MTTEETIFAEATKLPASERMQFVSGVCKGNKALEQRLKDLLSAHESENGILDFIDSRERTVTGVIAEGDQIGAYRLIQEIGEGGFGVVFMAQQRHPVERKVAIKIVKPGMDSRAVVARFENERQALAMMDHPNIASVFDGGSSDDGRPYFVMELVDGVVITEFCDASSLSIRGRLELFVSVCNAVHHAHQKGVIHRDIKPGNVMITMHDGKPIVKVIDFGVAKALHQSLAGKTPVTREGTMVGTLQYMSPEQAGLTEGGVDTRSDIYSLCVLLYELLTGTTPVDAVDIRSAGLKELQQLICEDEPPRPSQRLSTEGDQLSTLAGNRNVSPARLTRELKGDLDWIVMKGLEKDRDRRYASARALAADIERFLSYQPVVAGPPSFSYRARKFLQRNQIKLTLVAAAVALVAALLFGLFNHRQHRLAAIDRDEALLGDAIDEAASSLATAIEAPSSDETWTSADLKADRVKDLVNESLAGDATISRADSFLERFHRVNQDRLFTHSIEELLVKHSTTGSIDSLQALKKGFQRILSNRGYDMDALSPAELTSQLEVDHAPIKLTDALELWLTTRIQLGESGVQDISSDEIERWTNAMNVADPDPLRTVIRAAIFQLEVPDKQILDETVGSSDLSRVCARKLSWLAVAYEKAGATERAEEIREYALVRHSNDLTLNYEHAIRLMEQRQFDEAIRYLMRCTSIRPQVAGVWRTLASALRQNGESSKALKTIRTALELDPEDATSHLQMSEFLVEDKQSQPAIVAAEAALKLDENLGIAYCYIGRANMDLGNYPRALAAFEEYQKRVDESELVSLDDWVTECQRQITAGR